MRGALVVPVLALLAVGCATSTKSLSNLTTRQWEQQVVARGVELRDVPNPLTATDAMVREARKLAGNGTAPEQLSTLQSGLFDTAMFPFSYDGHATLTAAEAFHRRQGNCLAFTNLFVAMARSLGVPATTALVLRTRGSERDGDLIVVNTHVIAVLQYGGATLTYDFDRSRDKRPSAIKILDDMWITALYLNNKGADELRAGHPEAALRHFTNSVKLAPGFAPAWGNLGVTTRRMGDVAGALAAYEKALSIEGDNPTVLTNLSALYTAMGKVREAELALLAGNMNRASPHVLIVRGDLELAQGRPKEALHLFRRAKAIDHSNADAWVAIAKAELALNNPRKARAALDKAVKLQAGNREARRLSDELKNPQTSAKL